MKSRQLTQRAVPALLVLAAVAFALVRVPYLSLPLERDEGEYAYLAQGMLAGEPPYRDAFDQKPPGSFVVYAGAIAVLGETVEAIHLALYLWTLATGVALFALVRRLSDPLAAALGVLVFAVVSADARITATAANTEMFMLLPMVISMLCLARALAGKGWGGWFACGAFAALACWFKPVAATHLGFVALVAAIAPGRRGRPGTAGRAVGSVAAGAAVASLPIAAALAAAGVLGEFVDDVIVHNLAYAGSVDAVGGLARLAFAVERQLPGFAVVWLLAGFALVAPPVAGRPARGLLGGWLVACLAGASIGLYFRPHYFIQALPPLAALCGIGLAGVARSVSGWVGPGIAVTGAAALALAPPLLANRATLFAGSPAAASRVIYGLNPFPESPRIADHLRATSEPDDRVLIVGSEPQILFYARRRSATRYIFFYPLLRDLPRALERQRQALLEIEAARPLLVVWVSLPTSLGVEGARGHPLLDSVRAMLRRDYRVELIARPVPGAAEYEFVEGPAAQRLDREARAAGGEPIWIAVYRRNS